uniref:Uncharacterized protein n=1 Tax=viral metagenome TaxID=1070528 RepID=A0A6C0IPU2_9ZZZZ
MTNISSLPTDPAGGGSIGGNVQITATEQSKMIDSMQQQLGNSETGSNKNGGIELSQNTIAELVSGIQNITKSGGSSLPSRDIPMDESRVAADEEVKTNYVPETENTDYIQDYQTNENIVREHEANIMKQASIEDIYEELQTPIIAMLIYFLFQLPAFKKYERRFIPGLFGEDMNINTYGILFNSLFIALIIFTVKRLLKTI